MKLLLNAVFYLRAFCKMLIVIFIPLLIEKFLLRLEKERVFLYTVSHYFELCVSVSDKKIMAPLAWFNVTHGQRYRFRVIGVGSIYPLRISVDGHELTMVASDGYDIQPFVVESFIINPGERYDFLLEANQSYSNYWVRAVSMEVGNSY